MECQWIKNKYKFNDLTIGIDKAVISIPFKKDIIPPGEHSQSEMHFFKLKEKHRKKEFMQLIGHARYILLHTFKSNLYSSSNKKLMINRIRVYSEIDGSAVCTVTLGQIYSNPVMSYEFNPSKLTSEGLIELDTVFTATLFNNYEALYTDGVVSHFEFFVDIGGVPNSSIALIDTGKRITTLHKNQTYHGKRNSASIATKYDKAAEQKTSGVLTRIEVRINRRDITFRNLVETDALSNPFIPFFVVPIEALSVIEEEWKKPSLASLILNYGIYGGVKNSTARKSIINRLRDFTVSWWQPEQLWTMFKEILLGFRPSFIGGGCQ